MPEMAASIWRGLVRIDGLFHVEQFGRSGWGEHRKGHGSTWNIHDLLPNLSLVSK